MMVFTCQKCGKNKLEEVVTGATRYSTIKAIGGGGILYEPFDEINDLQDGEVDRYQCSSCGEALLRKDGYPIRSYEELVDWLEENQ